LNLIFFGFGFPDSIPFLLASSISISKLQEVSRENFISDFEGSVLQSTVIRNFKQTNSKIQTTSIFEFNLTRIALKRKNFNGVRN